MLYLSYFAFPGSDREWEYRLRLRTTYHDTIYPFYVLPDRGMDEIFFKPVTILYGGNGSGKSTILNVIARRLGLERATPWNSSEHFDAFCDMCRYTTDEDIPEGSCIVTSDDVFDFMLNLRSVNEGVERSREDAAAEYFRLQHERVTVRSLDDYDRLRKTVDARRKTLSRYIAGETGKGCASIPTARARTCISAIRYRAISSACWMSRKTACRPRISGSWRSTWRPACDTAAASS